MPYREARDTRRNLLNKDQKSFKDQNNNRLNTSALNMMSDDINDFSYQAED